MASYLQGVTDYIPQVQPWTPDYNFYQGALEQKQKQYDMGWEKTNTLYNSLLNAPMTREDNIGKRDQFFKNIEQDIQRLSGLDLSTPQNVDAASQMFTPLIKDNYIVNDIGWTKKYQNEQQRAEAFRNCTDPKKCGGKYWEEGVRALQYMRNDFQKTTADGALGMSAPRYVPYTNAVEKAFDKIKSNKDIGTKTVNWSPDGRYIMTETNGQNMIQPLSAYLASTLGNDPEVTDMYKTKAYVQRNDWMASNTGKYADEQEAEDAYYQQFVQPAVSTMEKTNDDIRVARKDRESDLTAFEQMIAEEGVIPGSEEHRQYENAATEFEKMLQLEEQSDSELASARNITSASNANVMRINSDAAVANAMFNNDMLNAAVTYHELTNKQEVKADQYALTAYRQNLAFNYGVKRDEIKSNLDRIAWREKQDVELAKLIIASKGTPQDNILTTEPDPVDGVIAEDGANEDNNAENQNFEVERQKDLAINEANLLVDVYNSMMALDPGMANLGYAWDFAQIFANTQALKKIHGDDWDKYSSNSSDRLIRKLTDGGHTTITPEDILKLDSETIDKMFKMARKQLDGRIGTNNKKKYAKIIWGQITEIPENQTSSTLGNVELAETAYKLTKEVRKTLWFGDKANKDPEKRVGLDSTFYNLALNGNQDLVPSFLGYKNEEAGVSYTWGTVQNQQAFLDAGVKNFIGKDGDLAPYPEFEETLLKLGISWYKADENSAKEKDAVSYTDYVGQQVSDGKGGFRNMSYEEAQAHAAQVNMAGAASGNGNPYMDPGGMLPGQMEAGDWFTTPSDVASELPLGFSGPELPYHRYDTRTGQKRFIESSSIDPLTGVGQETYGADAGDFYMDSTGRVQQGVDPSRSPAENRQMARDLWEKDIIRGAKLAISDLYYGTGGPEADEDRESEWVVDPLSPIGAVRLSERKAHAGGFGLTDLHFNLWSKDIRAENIQSYSGGSGGKSGQKQVASDINSAVYASSPMKFSQSLFNNLNAFSEELKFQDTWVTPEKGKQLINEFSKYVYDNQWKTTDKDRPRFSVKYLTDYKDPNYVKAELFFDRKWIEDNDGTAKNPGLTGNGTDPNTMYQLAEDGLTVLLPKDKANNMFETSAGHDVLDMLIKSKGHYDWQDRYELAGDFQIRYDKKNNWYYTTGQVHYYNDEGKLIKQPIPREQNDRMKDKLITFSQVRAYWEPVVADLHYQNEAYDAQMKSLYGEKDPSKLKGTYPKYSQ